MKNVEDLYPLTPTQAGMLFQVLQQEDPELYFEQVRADLPGVEDPAEVLRAFETVTRRHSALRTAIAWEGLQQPLQAVRATFDLPFEVISQPGITDHELSSLAAQRRQVPFELTDAPLQRIAVVNRGGGPLHLIWEFHHIVCDGWSVAMVLDEVVGLLNGRELGDRATPFRNYLAWHQAQDAEATAAYWKQLLDGVTGPTPITLPRPGSETAFVAGEPVVETITGANMATLERFARQQRVTLNTIVQGAWSLLQAAYSGTSDVIFGVTTSGRPADLDDVESIVGMFLNTLPMRVETAPDQPVGSWLQMVQRQQQSSAEHATASLADLHRQVGIAPGENLFDAMLVFENFPQPIEQAEQTVSLRNKQVFEQTNHPLTLMVGVDAGELKLVAHHDSNRFEPASVTALMKQFAHVINGLTAAETVGEVSVLTETDTERLSSWQGPRLNVDPSATVIDELISQVQRTPDAVALIEGEFSLTFAELIDRARGVAARLERLGVGPEVAVGVAIPRSIDMVVALVGTMLAGGAYVPLDPRYPQARLQLMLEASEARVVLTVPGSMDAVPTSEGVQLVDVQTIPHLRGGPAPSSPSTPESTLMLTFTSGSTGVPKGVRIHHAGMMNRFAWQWDRYPFVDGEVVAAKTTLGFADHLWELWGALLKGVPAVLVDDDTVTDPDALIALLGQHPVRRMVLVPSLLDLLLDHEPDLRACLPHLDLWTVSGEALAERTATRFNDAMPGATLINLYGMSEASADVTWVEVDTTTDAAPIGSPIANMAVHLLDASARPVPVGVPGEMFVSGVGLSPGYWRRPDLTAERFVPSPHAPNPADPHHIMYRTGDIGRWRNDGVLEYLGRTDHQVKVRGVRIELGEVETALARHPDVDRAVASGRPGRSGHGLELVAYVVPSSGSDVGVESLRSHASQHLPEAMLPSHYVVLDDFPLLPNGKVDRSSLPEPTVETGPTDSGPLTDQQSEMLAVWRSTLGLPHLGADVDFFDAGGHSMLAMRLVSRIKNELGLTTGLSQLLRTGTARSLADALQAGDPIAPEGRRVSGLRFGVPMLELDPSLPNLFVVHGAGGDVLNFRDLARHTRGQLNIIGVQAAGVDGVSDMHADRNVQIDDYIADIRTIQPEGPYLIGGFSIGGIIATALVERMEADGDEVAALFLLDTFHPTLRPRSIPRREHAVKVIRDPRYLADRLLGKVRDRLDARERGRVLAPDFDGPIPFEVRKWQVTHNSVDLWFGFTVPRVTVPTVLFSSVDNSDIWDGVAADRGWPRSASELQVIRVPGDHMTLVEEPHVDELSKRLVTVLIETGHIDA